MTATTGHGNHLTIADVKGTDAISGGGTNETFAFSDGFGHATIADASSHWNHSSGTHDIIELAKSEFANGFASLFNDASVLDRAISIIAGKNRLVLEGFRSKTELKAAKGDFTFV